MTYPEGTLHADSEEGRRAVQRRGDDGCGRLHSGFIGMLAEDEQFLGEGNDTLEAIKKDFNDVLCSSFGEAAGCMHWER